MYTDCTTTAKVLAAIQKSNALVDASLALSEANMAALQEMVDQSALFNGDLTGLAQLMLHQLLVWPPAHRFAALDALRLLLLNRPSRACDPTQTFAKILKAGWGDDSCDWRCRFNALKCICNLLPELRPAMLEQVWDELLSLLNQGFCDENMNAHEMVASAQTILNLSIAFSRLQLGEAARNQIATCLVTTFLPRAVANRKMVFDSVIEWRKDQKEQPLSKEFSNKLQKADEVMTLMLQAVGNMLLASTSAQLGPLLNALNAESVIQELVDVDRLIHQVYPGTPPPISCAVVRSLIREVIFLDLV